MCGLDPLPRVAPHVIDGTTSDIQEGLRIGEATIRRQIQLQKGAHL